MLLALIAPALHAAPPLELEIVQLQYETAVTAPYAAAKTELDTKFIGALTKAASTAMEAGKLDEVLAIQADQKCLTEKLPIPDDDSKLPEVLTKLRSIYRAQLARVEAQRVANHTAFLPGYTAKLKDLETHLTKATRIADASEVKTYRESLLAAPAATPKTQPVEKKPHKDAFRMGKSFYLIVEEPQFLSWSAAKAKCEAMGGSLISVNTEKEWLDLLEEMGKQKLVVRFWIGLQRTGNGKDDWGWLDGTTLTFDWFDRAIDLRFSDLANTCAGCAFSPQRKWHIYRQDDPNTFTSFVCEWPMK